jgi:hypothetical protein
MANENKRLRPAQIEVDRASFAALQTITGYAPANAAFALAKITEAEAAVRSRQAAEAQAEAALAAARDAAVASEWEFHNLIIGAKDQVMAQFGRDSNEVQAVGRKKASERKAPVRRAKPGAAGQGG